MATMHLSVYHTVAFSAAHTVIWCGCRVLYFPTLPIRSEGFCQDFKMVYPFLLRAYNKYVN